MKEAFSLYFRFYPKWFYIQGILSNIISNLLIIYSSIIIPSAIAKYFVNEIGFKVLIWTLSFKFIFTIISICWDHIINCKFIPKYTSRFEKGIYKMVFNKMNELSLKLYDDNSFFEKYILATQNVSDSVYGLTGWLNNFISLLISLISATIIVALVDFKVILIMIACLILTGIIQVLGAIFTIRFQKEYAKLDNIFKYIRRVFYLKDYAIELRTSNISKVILKLFDKNLNDAKRVTSKIMGKGFLLEFLEKSINDVIMYFTLLVYACYRIAVLGQFSVSELVTLLLGAFTLYNLLTQFLELFTNLFENKKKFKLFSEFMDLNEEDQTGTKELKANSIQGSIIFDKVNFAYDNDPVIKDLTLEILIGSTIAIVGPNGAGKSTFVKLLQNYYKADSGRIEIAGNSVYEYDVHSYRNLFSAVSQYPLLFELSVADNVLLRKCTTESDRKKVCDALKMVGLWEKIETLTNGIDSIVGKEFDTDGVLFSGGELQRIAIARAIVQNRPFLILDEPSSHLDPIAERELFDLMKQIKKGKTVIFITHNIRNVMDADQIVWLENGMILEKGTHEELIELKGKYYDAYNSRYNILK